MRSKIAASMDLVDRIGHLSCALSRLRHRASSSCYTADWGVSPRLQEQLGIRHNDRQSADLMKRTFEVHYSFTCPSCLKPNEGRQHFIELRVCKRCELPVQITAVID